MDDEKRMQRVGRFLEPGLTRPPGVTVYDIKLPKRRRQLPTPVRALAISAVLLFSVLLASFFNTDLARAIASLPGAGDIYQRAITNWNLRVAYNMDLVNKFSKVIELPEATIEVFASYSDALSTVVAFEVRTHDGDPKAIFDKYRFTIMPDNWLFKLLSSSSNWGGLGYAIPLAGETITSADVTTDPLPWWWFWSVPFNVISSDEPGNVIAKVRIPVSRAGSQTVRVNRHFDLTGAEVELRNVRRPFWANQEPLIWVDRVIFTPVSTRIDYDSTRIMPYKWTMETDDGSRQSNGWSFGVQFPPLSGDSVRFTLLSYQLYLGTVSLPLQRGTVDNSVEGVEITLTDVDFGADYTTFSVTVTSERNLVRPSAWIPVGQGNGVAAIRPPVIDGNTITYVFPPIDPTVNEYVNLNIQEELECNISFEVER